MMNLSSLKHLVLLDKMKVEKDAWVTERRGVCVWTLKDLMNMKEEEDEEDHATNDYSTHREVQVYPRVWLCRDVSQRDFRSIYTSSHNMFVHSFIAFVRSNEIVFSGQWWTCSFCYVRS